MQVLPSSCEEMFLYASDCKMQECSLPMPGVMSSNLADIGQNSIKSFEMTWNSLDSDMQLS